MKTLLLLLLSISAYGQTRYVYNPFTGKLDAAGLVTGPGTVTAAGRIACTPQTISGASTIAFDTSSPTGGPCNFVVATTGAANVTLTVTGGGSDNAIQFIQGGTARTIALAGNLGDVNTPWCPASTLTTGSWTQLIEYDGTTYKGAGCSSTDPSVVNYCGATTEPYACTLTGPLSALTNGVQVVLKASSANVGGATLTVTGLGGSSLGAVDIFDAKGNALSDGCIAINEPAALIYNSSDLAWIMSRECVASVVSAGGATYPVFGYPSFLNSEADVINPAYNGANTGITIPWLALVPTLKGFSYKVVTAASAGKGMTIGIYAVDGTTGAPSGAGLCYFNASGNDVETTGWKYKAFSAGTAVSGGTCTLTAASAYSIVLSADDAGLMTITRLPDPTVAAASPIHSTAFSYYSGVTTGTGGSMVMTAASSWTGGTPVTTTQKVTPYLWFGN